MKNLKKDATKRKREKKKITEKLKTKGKLWQVKATHTNFIR
jgi:hypothetical protein